MFTGFSAVWPGSSAAPTLGAESCSARASTRATNVVAVHYPRAVPDLRLGFLHGRGGANRVAWPWIDRRSDETTVFLYDQPGTEVEVDEEDDPSGEDEEAERSRRADDR